MERTSIFPSIGVVVVNYDAHESLGRCLECIATQTVVPERIIVVENGRLDLELSARWERQGVEFIFPGENLGFARGNNLAIRRLVGCELVALVNPDAFLEPDWIAEMCRVQALYPDAASFASCLLQASNRRQYDGLGDAYHLCGAAWRIRHGSQVDTVPKGVADVFSACAAAAVYRIEPFLAAGGFDEDYFCYFEDVDLGFRLRLAGHRCILVPTAVAAHAGGGTSGGARSKFATYHGHRNLEWTYAKNMPASLLVLGLPLHLLFLLASLVWLSFRGQCIDGLRAKLDAILGMRRALSKRASVQASRKVSALMLLRSLDKRLWRRQ